MAVAKLQLASIRFSQDELESVLDKVVAFDDLHLEPASTFSQNISGIGQLQQENIYEELFQSVDVLINKYGVALQEGNINTTEFNLVKEKDFIEELHNEVVKYEEVINELEAMIAENVEAAIQVQHLCEMNIDLDELFDCKYLKIRFGKLPVESVQKLSYYNSLPFVYRQFDSDKLYVWCMYITTPMTAPEIDNIFASMHFERVMIPAFAHGQPELAIVEIQEESDAAKNHIVELKKSIVKLIEKNRQRIEEIYYSAKYHNELHGMQKYILVVGKTLTIYGFINKKKEGDLKQLFEADKNVRVDFKPANSDVRLQVPTKLSNNWFTRPFSIFVEMYGIPGYNDIDPTGFVAITYSLLFGIMFADVGQGLVLSILGYLVYKIKGIKLGLVGVALGIASALFGCVFGSIFGNEEIIPALFHPMHPESTMQLFMMAIAIGVLFIIISMSFNIYLGFKEKDYGRAIFHQNGICGLIFYVGIIAAVAGMMLGVIAVSPLYIVIVLIIPIIGVFFKEPIHRKLHRKNMFPAGVGEFFLEGVFELIEVLLSYVTNTMSFLRVGGFVLAHSGMMLVVYTLATMVGGIGYWIILIAGNLFVMALEGLIVGIQVLRLEFYEMFSRYYSGNGKPFVKINQRLKKEG